MAKVEQLAVGSRAPHIQATSTDGNLVPIETFWAKGPVLVAFLRHFG
ncbi:MAG: hypothetical protein OHK0023_26360 [Anaerolineae bacterium]